MDQAVSPNLPTSCEMPSRAELETLFRQKHGNPETTGWGPKRRFGFGYYNPADVYESLVSKLVFPGCTWLDVGGGDAIFPENAELARQLAQRAGRLVAVDPSDNVQQNPYAQEKVQSFLEEYHTNERFDLATMRMVVEHVGRPESFLKALSGLLKPGGLAVVFTVNFWTPVSLCSAALPFGSHHGLKRLFWGSEEKDTFPVEYRMNTRGALRSLFHTAGFDEVQFAKLDDLSVFGQFKRLNYLELLAWTAFRSVGLHYPENCLLGVYRRRTAVS